MPNDCRTYKISNIEQLRLDLKNRGIEPPSGNSGILQGPAGVKLSFDYDGQSALTLCILQGEIFASRIWSTIEDALKTHKV